MDFRQDFRTTNIHCTLWIVFALVTQVNENIYGNEITKH